MVQRSIHIQLIILCVIPAWSYAQNLCTDSLKAGLPSLTGKARADRLNMLSTSYQTENTDSSFFYAMLARETADAAGYWEGVSESYANMGHSFRLRGAIATAEGYYQKACGISDKHKHSERWRRDRIDLGFTSFLLGKYPEAYSLLQDALQSYLSANNEQMADYCYRKLGNVYSDQGFYEKAFYYFQKSIAINGKTTDVPNPPSAGNVWNFQLLGMVYRDAGDQATALDYYRLSLESLRDSRETDDYYKIKGDIANMQGNWDSAIAFYTSQKYYIEKKTADKRVARTLVIDPLLDIGEMYLHQKKYNVAKQHFIGLMPEIAPSGFNIRCLRMYKGLARAYLETGDDANALKYAGTLLTLAEQSRSRQYVRDGFEYHWRVFDASGQTDRAYFYYRRYTGINDSLAIDMQLRNIAVGQMKLWNEKQDMQIQLLSAEKQLQQKKSQLLFYGLIAFALIALIVLWIILLKRKYALDRAKQLENTLKLHELESKSIKIEFESKRKELEMQALRAQMNPHFIFNSLNAINRFILENDRLQASSYLTSFSRLIRMILHHSQQNLISLEDELAALRIYLELEALRFDHHFTYTIEVYSGLDTESLQVAPLLIQPYVENAIWHGLMHKKEAGTLTITITEEEHFIVCRITDNGIGRPQAALLKNNSGAHRESVAMRITEERISHMDSATIAENPVKVRDLSLADGTPGGTEITLKIPIIYA